MELNGYALIGVEHLVSHVGARTYLSEWHRTGPGGLRELKLLLGVLDPEVCLRSELVSRPMPARHGEARGLELFVLRPGVVLRLTCEWRRPSLVHHAVALRSALDALLQAWLPAGIDGIEWSMTWRGRVFGVAGPTLRKATDPMKRRRLMEQYVREFLGLQRLPALPVRTLIAVEPPELVQKQVGEVVLSDRSMDSWLQNLEPLDAVWRRVEERRDEAGLELLLECLRDGERRLALLVAPWQAGPMFELDGAPVPARQDRRWPGRRELELPRPTLAGQRSILRVRPSVPDGARSEMPSIHLNPCGFVPSKPEANGRYRIARELPLHPAGTFVNVVAGRPGLTGPKTLSQPLPLFEPHAAESDCEYFGRARRVMRGQLDNRSSIERHLKEEFPELGQVTCRKTIGRGAKSPSDQDAWDVHAKVEHRVPLLEERLRQDLRELLAPGTRFNLVLESDHA